MQERDAAQQMEMMMGKRKSRLREENGVRLAKRVWRVIDSARGGQTLCKSLRKKETGETEVEYAFEPSLKHVPAKSAKEAIASGFLKARGDGLFGDDSSQTWVAA